MSNLAICYSHNITTNSEGENVLSIYDKYGNVHFTTVISDELANAPEENHLEYIESTFSKVIQDLANIK